jgi:hypothetical protein
MTLLAVIHCGIMEPNYESDLINQASLFIINNTTLKKDDFMNLKFWFESKPNSSCEYSEVEISLKHVLYEINKDDNVRYI